MSTEGEGGMIHYLKNKVGAVDFANAQGVVMFLPLRAVMTFHHVN